MFFKLRFRARWVGFLLIPPPSQSPLKIVVKVKDVLTNLLRTSSHKLVPKTRNKTRSETKTKNRQKETKRNNGGLAKLLIDAKINLTLKLNPLVVDCSIDASRDRSGPGIRRAC